MLKHLYLALEEKLLALTADGTSTSERGAGGSPQPLFRHCDLWNRQVEFIEEETPFQTPAVFVEFADIQWRTLGQHVQEADLTVRLHIVTPWYANTASNVLNADVRAAALAYLDIPTALFRQLHGQHGTVAVPLSPTASPQSEQDRQILGTFNALTRVGSTVNHDHERFVDSVETYQCHLKDLSFTVPTFAVDTVNLAVRPAP